MKARTRLILAVVLPSLVILGIFMATRAIIARQEHDSMCINLAGRQRMLSQKITKELLVFHHACDLGEPAEEAAEQARASIAVFARTLAALRDGGNAPLDLEMTECRECPGVSEEILPQMKLVSSIWGDFLTKANRALEGEEESEQLFADIMAGSLDLLREMDKAVGMMQAESERKLGRLFQIQVVGLLAGAVCVTWAFLMVGALLRRVAAAARVLRGYEEEGTAPLGEESGAVDEFDAVLHGVDRLGESLSEIEKHKQAEETLLRRTERLQESNEDLDAFARTVAHDLKAPLSVIDAARELEKNLSSLSDHGRSELLEMVGRNVGRMNRIVDELLLLSEMQGSDVEREPLDMAEIVDEVLQRLGQMAEELGAEIVMPESWHGAVGHGPWIEQVWVNYMSNGLKYGGRPPRLEFGSAAESNGFVRFWISDNGVGLTPEEQAGLFAPFKRLNQTRAEGHGLGLSIVRRIVYKLGGDVGMESEVGKGSTFAFTLPGAASSGLPC